MSDERDALRYAARRAALHDAVQRGDAAIAARAAARLRVDGFPALPDEFARARTARRTLGIAIVKARLPKTAEPPLRREAMIPASIGASRRRWYAAAAAIVVLLVVYLARPGSGPLPGSQDGGAPPAAAAEPQRAIVLTLSRGRTVDMPEIVAVEESPTPAPTAEPTAEPTAVVTTGPARTTGPSRTAGSGGGSGSGGGGSDDGGGSGSGGGGILPSPTATPPPTPTATPPVPPPGYTRLNIVVYDAQTGRPVADACVVIGTLNCGPSAPHTDIYGRYSADVAASSSSTKWDIYIIKTGYQTQFREITLPSGASRFYVFYLRRQI